MRKLAKAALAGLALAGAAASGAAAHGGGGGHGGGYVIVYMGQAGPPPPLFQGKEASMALEVTEAPPTQTEGDVKLGDIIAVHQVRAVEAIVLTAPAKGHRREIPAGTVLVRARFVDPAEHAVVWCDVRPTGWPFHPFNHDCFQDAKGSGQLDTMWRADYQTGDFLGFSRSGVDAGGDPMEAPVAYRPARPEERPTAFIGYKYCDGDDVASPARFRLVAGADPDPTQWRLYGDCRAGLWPDPADKSKVDVDGLAVIVTPGAPGTLHVKLAGRIAPGPIGPVVRYAALRNTPIDPAARDAALKTALVLAGDPPKLTTGTASVGQPFWSAAVKHGLTGRLMVRERPTLGLFWPKGTSMEIGQPVFGVPTFASPGDGIAWCAPTRTDTGWVTACLVPIWDGYMEMTQTTQGYYWQAKQKPALAPSRQSLGGGGEGDPASTDPVVAPGPIDDGPPLTATLKLVSARPTSRADPTLTYEIEADIDWGEGPQRINRVSYKLPPAGQAIRVLGQTFLLKPGPDATQVEVSAAPANVDAPTDFDLLSIK